MPTPEPIPDYNALISQELEEERNKNAQLNNALYNSEQNLFSNEETSNLVKWQLDQSEDLDKIYHLLRGDIIGYNDKGEMSYLPQKNPTHQPFNDYGVQIIMQIMTTYLNRNTILSNYDLQTIQWKVNDFGIRVTDFIFNKYEDMMCTIETDDYDERREHIKDKIKLYDMIVGQLVDIVHSAYLRAYNGGERESLRTARHVTQTEPLGRGSMGMGMPMGGGMGMGKRKSSWWNPTSYM